MNDRINATRYVVARKVLAEHQRQALHALDVGSAHLSRTERSFLMRMSQTPFATDRQGRWISDLDRRVTWEAANVPV